MDVAQLEREREFKKTKEQNQQCTHQLIRDDERQERDCFSSARWHFKESMALGVHRPL